MTIVCVSPQDDEINLQCQLVEKLKEQMLDQDEVRTLTRFPSLYVSLSQASLVHAKVLITNMFAFYCDTNLDDPESISAGIILS